MMSEEQSTSLAPLPIIENDFCREDAVQAIADKLRRDEWVHFPLGEHWTAVMKPTWPKVPKHGDMSPVGHVSVFLQIATPLVPNVIGSPVRSQEARLPGVVVLGRSLDCESWGYIQPVPGVYSAACCRHDFFRGETLSEAVRVTLKECNAIFARILQHYEDKRRAEESREQSIKQALAEHARRMAL